MNIEALNCNYFSNPEGFDFNSLSNIEQSIFCLIVMSLLLVLSLVLGLAWEIYSSQKGEFTHSTKKEKYQDYLSFVISNHVQNNFLKDESNLRQVYLNLEDIQQIENRNILRKELISLHNMISGPEKQRLKDLYLGFGFAADISKQIVSKDWKLRIQAIYEIGSFNLVQFYPNLVSCLDDRNANVRKAAFTRYTSLVSNPIDALEHISGSINKWEKHIIISNLKQRSGEMIPVFSNYKILYPLHVDFLDELAITFNQNMPQTVRMERRVEFVTL